MTIMMKETQVRNIIVTVNNPNPEESAKVGSTHQLPEQIQQKVLRRHKYESGVKSTDTTATQTLTEGLKKTRNLVCRI